MTQAGWYPDPYGGGGHRWWDGAKWTGHVDSTPPQPVPSQPAASVRPAAALHMAGPVLHKNRRGVELRADPHSITWDGRTIELARAEFVGYSRMQSRMRGMLNISIHNYSEYRFEIGIFPVNEAPGIAFEETGLRANKPPDDWKFLVDLVQAYVEPRLISEFLAAINAGETVDVAKVKLNREGFRGANVSRRWEQVQGVTHERDHYWINEKGGKRPILAIPQINQNTPLLPRLFDALKR